LRGPLNFRTLMRPRRESLKGREIRSGRGCDVFGWGISLGKENCQVQARGGWKKLFRHPEKEEVWQSQKKPGSIKVLKLAREKKEKHLSKTEEGL